MPRTPSIFTAWKSFEKNLALLAFHEIVTQSVLLGSFLIKVLLSSYTYEIATMYQPQSAQSDGPVPEISHAQFLAFPSLHVHRTTNRDGGCVTTLYPNFKKNNNNNRTPHDLHNFSSVLFFVSKGLTSYKIIYQTPPQVVKAVLSPEKEGGGNKRFKLPRRSKKKKIQKNFLLVSSLHSLKAPPKNIYTTSNSKPTLLLTLTLPLFLAPQRLTNTPPGRSTPNLYEICYSFSCTLTKAYITKPYFLKPLR